MMRKVVLICKLSYISMSICKWIRFFMFLPLTPDGIQAFYNWAIAISDRAKMRGRTKEAEELWKQVNK